ncbi:MAG: hypothetical protein AAGB31_01030 [Bdellovibrio sp.]
MKNDFYYLRQFSAPEITTKMLLGAFSGYEDGRGKIHSLSRKGFIKPIKQGVYLLNEDFGFRPYSKEILANLIYAPSYISLETALSNYGFIPEQVRATTSISMGRGKSFSTSIGDFEYHHLKDSLYPAGIQLREVFPGAFCLHATPEKALCDFLYIKETKGEFKQQKDYFEYLVESYRFDLEMIEKEVSLRKLQSISESYPFQHVHWFTNELIRKLLK